MNSSNYSAWMERAFLHVEGTLLQRAAEESPTRITEDFVRGALINGLKASKSSMANSVLMEEDVPWNNATNILSNGAKFGGGRPKQHDVSVKDNAGVHLVCELKWLKTEDSEAVMEDLWKLALGAVFKINRRPAVALSFTVAAKRGCRRWRPWRRRCHVVFRNEWRCGGSA